MSDELFFEGVRYISATDAATVFGLHRDYIARLARQGKLDAKRIGKTWYVSEKSIATFVVHREFASAKRNEELAVERKHEYRKAIRASTFDTLGLPNFEESTALENNTHRSRISTKKLGAQAKLAAVAAKKNAVIHSAHVAPLYAINPAFDFLHRLAAVVTAVVLIVGGYAFAYPDTARSVIATAKHALFADSTILSNSGSQIAAAAGNPLESVAKRFNRAVDTFVFETMFGRVLTLTPGEPGRVTITVAPSVRATPSPVRQPTVTTPQIIERTTQTERVISVAGVTKVYVDQGLASLRTELLSRMVAMENANSTSFLSVSRGGSSASGGSNVDLSNVTITGGTITGVTITGGSVTATAFSGVLPVANGGTGTSTYAAGDILYADAANSLARLPVGANGRVLKLVGGIPSWQPDLSGGGGSGAWATTTDDLAIYPSDTSDVVLIGTNATSTTGNILEVFGNALFRGSLTSYFNLTAPRFTATSSVASVFPYASTTALSATTLCLSADCRTTWPSGDGDFSTTSALHFSSQGLAFSTTSANYWETQQPSRSSDDLTNNSIEDLSDVAAMTENFGDLFAWNGSAWTDFATSSLAIALADTTGTLGATRGGTGLSSITAAGILLGNYQGTGWQQLATSTLGLLTTDVTEGSNLYYTNARVQTYLDTIAKEYFFATTSASYFASQGLAFSTTSAIHFVHSSTTIPKTYTANTFTALQTFGNASTSLLSTSYASSTLYFGAGLANCAGGNMLTWTDGRFGCEDDTVGGGGGSGSNWLVFGGTQWLAPSSTIGLIVNASSTFNSSLQVAGNTTIGGTLTATGGLTSLANLLLSGSTTLQNFTAVNSTTTNATSTTFAITGITNSLLKTTGAGAIVPAIAGTDYVTSSQLFAYPFPNNATTTFLAFNGGLSTTNASTSNLSAYTAAFGGTATATISSTGVLSLPTALAASSGGTGIANPSAAGILLGSYAGGSWQQLATSSLGLLTTHVAEGSNLYFTDERVDDRVNALLQAGSGVNLNYDDNANTLTISSTGGGGGGSDVNWTYFNGSGIRPSTTTNQVLVGGSSTSTLANPFAKLGVIGGASFDAATSSGTMFGNRIAGNTAAFGGSATTSIDTAGNVVVGGTLNVSGQTTLANASTTNLTTSNLASTSQLVASNSFTFSNVTGFLKATAGVVATAAIDLASDVTGILTTARGGTGWGNIQANTIVLGNGTGALATTSAGTNGQVLALAGGVPTWSATTTFSGGLTYSNGNVTADLGTSISAAEIANGDHGDFTYTGGVAAIDADAIALATDTTGNFIATLSSSGSITVGNSGSENAAVTVNLNLGNSNSWTALQSFTNASSTQLSSLDYLTVGRTATTTIRGDNVASTLPFASTTALSATTLCLSADCRTTWPAAGLTAYDAWTHPAAGQSATTSLMLFNGGASSTLLSANRAWFGGTATTSFDTAGNAIIGNNLNVTGQTTLATSLNGPLQANAGVVSATTSIGVRYGGTGLTTDPSYGQLLVGNSSGGYTLTATSSLGLVTAAVTAIGPTGQTSDGPTVTLATTTSSFNGLTAALTIVGSGDTQTFTPSLSGSLADAGIDNNITLSGGTIGSNSISGTLTTTGTLTIGDNGDRIDIDSNTWDVTNGAFSGLTTLNLSGAITSTATGANTLPFASTTMITATTASSTNLFISGLGAGGLLKTNAGGQVALAVAGTDYLTDANREWRMNFGALAPTTTLGIIVNASSTIGNGTQAGGLTVSGGATTTGNLVVQGSGNSTFTNGVVGIGTTTPWAKLSVHQSTVTTAPLFAIASSTSLGASTTLVVMPSGYVGVNTASPSAPLHVLSNAANATNFRYEFLGGGGNSHGLGLYYGSNRHMSLSVDENGNADVQSEGGLSFVSNGNFDFYTNGNATEWASLSQHASGFGTTSPFAMLGVQKNFGSTAGAIFAVASSTASNGSTANTFLSVSGTGFGTTTLSGLNINGSATTTSNVGVRLTGGCFAGVDGVCVTNQDTSSFVTGAGSGALNRVAFWTGASSLSSDTDLQFDGTTLTARDLLVSHTAPLFSMNDTDTTGTDFSINVGDGAVTFNADINTTAGTAFIAFANDAVEQMRLTANGNLGVGTTSPYAKLSVAGDVVGARFVATTSVASVFPFASTTALSATTLCLSTDCRTSWPSGGGASFGQSWEVFGGGTFLAPTSTLTVAIPSARLGVATTSPWGQLSIGTHNLSPLTPSFVIASSSLSLATTTQFIVRNGLVGIGTSSPYARLSVVGEAVAEKFTATSTSATSTFAGGLNVGNGALTYDFSAGLTSIENLSIGAMEFDTNAGIVSWTDMPVTSAASAGTAQSYTAQIDGNPLLTLAALSDGAGGIFSRRVGIASSTPWGILSIDAATTSIPAIVVGSSTATRFQVSALGVASSTGLVVSNLGGSGTRCLQVGADGTVSAVGTACGSDPFTHPSATVSATTSGLIIAASSTIGSGAAAGGLTISGDATTTGVLKVQGNTTSTFAGGINLTGGCYAVNGVCIGYVKRLAAIYSTSTPGTNARIQFSGGGAPSFSAGLLTLPSSTTEMVVEVWSGGGGGSGSGTASGGNGGLGGTSSFGNGTGSGLATTSVTGGGGGTYSGPSAGGAGGVGSSGDVNMTGDAGQASDTSTASVSAGAGGGGSAPRGGGGGVPTLGGVAGGAGAAFGGGGAGGGCSNTSGCFTGPGGGGGGYGQKVVVGPSGTYYYNVGAGGTAGTAGTSGFAGGVGGAGGLVVMVYATSSPTASGNDYAEMFPVSSGDINAGDIVSVDTGLPVSMKKAIAGDRALAGVISTAPGHTLGDINTPGMRPVALMGRVPVKFSAENGMVQLGDRIAPSSIPGVGMKASAFDDSIGIVIGPVEHNQNGEDTVMIFLDLQRGVDIDAIGAKLLGEEITLEGDASDAPFNFIDRLLNSLSTRLFGLVPASTVVATNATSSMVAASSTSQTATSTSQAAATTSATTSTTTNATTTSTLSSATSFLKAMFAKFTEWFADTANGIGDFFAKKIHTEEVCVAKSDGTEICVTGDQLETLLGDTGEVAGNSSNSASGSTTTPATPQEPEDSSGGEAQDPPQEPEETEPTESPPDITSVVSEGPETPLEDPPAAEAPSETPVSESAPEETLAPETESPPEA